LRNDNGLPADRLFNPQDEKNTIIYAFALNWAENGWVDLGFVKPTSNVSYGDVRMKRGGFGAIW
jgi:hypothetical protein